MINAEQARKDLLSNEQADRERQYKNEAKKEEAERKETARALKEDVPKMLAEIEKKIYAAVGARNNSTKYTQSASVPISQCFDAIKKELESHGYKVRKDFDSGTTDYSDDCRNIPYENYILYITW